MSSRNKIAQIIEKGQNPRTEMYSVFAADVKDPTDPTTAFNEDLMSKLNASDQLLICGKARSDSVQYSLMDLYQNWLGGTSSLFLLEDGYSSTSDFEQNGIDLLDDLRSKGMTVINCEEVFPDEDNDGEIPEPNTDDSNDSHHSEAIVTRLTGIESLLTTNASVSNETLQQILATLKQMQDRISILEGTKAT